MEQTMALTPSTMLELGIKAPEFSLIEPLTQNIVSLSDFKGKPILVAFICNHCPYVVLLKDAFEQFTKKYQALGLNVIAINANDIENYPADSPERMIEDAKNYSYSFPYLFDETQQVATNYKAACTPDFFLFNSNHELYYRGQFDSARPNSGIEVTGNDMRKAVDDLLAGKDTPIDQTPSVGCGIKWKQGHQPEYF